MLPALRALLLILLLSYGLRAQQKPGLEAVRTEEGIRIDGTLDEAAWQSAPVASDFTTLRPNPDQPSRQRTEVKIVYDNRGIYVGAMLYDSRPDSILAELTERDDLGNTDFFGFVLDPYQSGITGFTFLVTPANVQYDAKQGANDEDSNWDAVWQSSTSRTQEGWIAEFFLPYSALRFPSTAEQSWTINFVRLIGRANEQSFWAAIDPNVDGFLNQSGTLTGLYDIKAPARIQATPFVAVYGLQGREPGDAGASYGSSVTGGMDLKVGLNDAFTLDMTLIPDFGEARSDDQVLNLGPFEQRFDEQRAFFTEGTELFGKADLFYSRRVGGLNYYRNQVEDALAPGETLVDNPQRATLYNATKISGRTAKGTGIGFFNAVEKESYATIRTAEGGERRQLTNPLTNYNVLVVDQNLPNNSSVSLINTSVLREGTARDANVTGLLFDLHNGENAYAIRGGYTHSRAYREEEGAQTGHALNFELARISGQWTYSLGYREESDTYDINDLGLLYANNKRQLSGQLGYNHPNPFFQGRLLSGGGGVYLNYGRLYAPGKYTGTSLEAYSYATTKGFWNLNLWSEHTLGDQFDYFEPRVAGRFWRSPGSSNVGGWVGTDNRKKLRFSSNFNLNRWWGGQRYSVSGNLNARYRFSDRFSLSAYSWQGSYRGDVGYAGQEDVIGSDELPHTAVYLGTRNRNSVEAGLNGKYSFSANMTLNLRVRHYWSGVAYDHFNLLGEDGRLLPTEYTDNHDQDFDAFNVDLIYRWRFAPGSDVYVIYKSSVTDSDTEKAGNYAESFGGLWRDTPRAGSLSLKVVYWLDYASLLGR